MKTALRFLALLPVLFLGACAGVSTHVVALNPAQTFAPTQFVEVLLEKPARPYVEIALIESHGGSEAELLNDAREKARAVGADAIIRVTTERVFHEPVAVYDPLFDPFYSRNYHRRRYFAPFGPDFYGGPWGGPWGAYQVLPGYYSYVLKATAVKFTAPAS